MKRTSLRVLAMLLCVVMVLSLAACGKEAPAQPSSSTAPAESQPGTAAFAYKGSFTPVTSDSEWGLSPALYTDDGFFATGSEKTGRREAAEGEVEEYDGQFDVYSTILYFVDTSGKATRLPNFVPSQPEENTEGHQDYSSYVTLGRPVMNNDGKLVALEEHFTSWYDGPDEARNTEDEYNYYHIEQKYDLLVLDTDGTELSRSTVAVDASQSYLNTNSSVCDAGGNLLTTMDSSVIAIAPDGSIAFTIPTQDYISSLVRFPDGTIGAMISGMQGMELRKIDMDAKSFGDPITLPNNVWTLLPGDGKYDFYYTSGMYLYGFHLGDESAEEVLNWMSCDINGQALDTSAINISPDGTIRGVITEYNNDKVDSQYFTLSLVPADSLPRKQVLTVAQLEYYPDYDLSNRIVRFNRSHDNVRIEYKDYNQYNTENDLSAGMTKFMTEVMAGNLPDILPTRQLPYKQLAAKGLLEDLYPYIDADKDLSREDFFPNLLTALEVNGSLYQMVPSFSVQTLSGASSIVGDTPGWNYDDFNAALAKMPEGCTPLDPYITRDSVLSSLLYADMDSYVNWSTGEVRFDSDSFKQLLEFTKQFPAEYNWEEHETTESTKDLLAQGRQMLTQTYLYSLDSVLWNDVSFGGQTTFIGWPTTNGVGSIMSFDNGYSISKNCTDKDAAWEFLRSMLTEDAQKAVYSIPVNRKVFDQKLEELMTTTYRKDAQGNFILDENGEKIPLARGNWYDENGEEHNVYAMTQEQADAVLAVITTCTKVANYDTSIYDIVNEQAQAFFAGQKSVDEVCRLIQSKANIYVNEQR